MARASRPEDLKFKTFADGYINIHPGSVCANLGTFETPYLVFQEKVQDIFHIISFALILFYLVCFDFVWIDFILFNMI